MRKVLAFCFGCLMVMIYSCNQQEKIIRNYEKAIVYLTAKGTDDKLSGKGEIQFDSLVQPDEGSAAIMIKPEIQYQAIIGFGGALTDASAETLVKLPAEKQEEILNAYYTTDKGIGYTLGRIPIHSSDFSSESHTYIKDNDTTLSTFNIEHDLKYRLPMIKRITALVPVITLFASPWSPPAWMKTNNDMLHGGKLKPECMNAWANYYVKFIREYKKQGINIWGLTVQNEPMAIQTWESCIFTAQDECDFVKKYLGPVLHKNNMQDIKLMIWDHNRGIMFQRAEVVYDDPEASKYVWGMGYHWYAGDHFENAGRVKEAYPEKHLLLTEACNYPYDSAKVNDWNWGENYGRSIINDLNNGAEGWTDWNILLDEKGGPNHVGNYCYAPIHGDTRNGNLTYQNSYYYMGHFSKFIRPGARRIACTSNFDELKATAFINIDGSIIVVVMNESEKDIDFSVWVNRKTAKTKSPAHSIVTIKI